VRLQGDDHRQRIGYRDRSKLLGVKMILSMYRCIFCMVELGAVGPDSPEPSCPDHPDAAVEIISHEEVAQDGD
jgi:hypothetical protein